VTNPAPGRHRAAAAAGRRSTATSVLAIALIAVVVAGIVVLFATRTPDPPPPATDTGDANLPTTSAPDAAGAVETIRTTTVDRSDVVTVVEVSRVVSDAGVVARPLRAAPTGLQLVELRVTGQDGRSTPFTDPVDVGASGSLTVTARYRLVDCPDVLPALWPSPTAFPNALQTYVRLDQPLHTAAALCPEKRFRSSTSSGIKGELLDGPAVRVQLSWNGGDTLSVSGIGSASGVAAVIVDRAAECGSDPSCLAGLDAVTEAGKTSTSVFSFKPADPCPPGTDSDRLVLLVTGGSFPPAPTAIEVKGLHQAVCGD
jgi:hypothetical protein